VNRERHFPLWPGLALCVLATFPEIASAQRIDLVPGPLLAPAPLAKPPDSALLRSLTETEILRLIAADLARAETNDRPYLRYFSVFPVWNALCQMKDLYDAELQARPRTTAATFWFSPLLGISVSATNHATLLEKTDAAARMELEAVQDSLSMLLNSLSWAKESVRVVAVEGSAGRVFRVRLSDYRRFDDRPWDATWWKQVLDKYPYGVSYRTDPTAQMIATLMDCDVPYVRADWFAYTAARPPLYHHLLGLPETVGTLERRLGVDVEANIAAGIASRAGFNSSPKTTPVSQHNRIIERHPLPRISEGAYYWKSYDFADNSPALHKDIFSSPLGPAPWSKSAGFFRHDGMEILFSLPNRLQAYMIANAHGDRLDQAPTTIVTDYPSAPFAVTNGFSCMRCHGAGLNPTRWDEQHKRFLSLTENQVLTHVEYNQKAFSADLEHIRKLYKEDKKLRPQMEEDIARFIAGLSEVAPRLASQNSTFYFERLGPSFESELGLTRAAAELGQPPREFQKNLQKTPKIARRLGILMIGEQVEESTGFANSFVLRGGTVKRQVFDETFPEMVREWGYAGQPPTEVTPAQNTPDQKAAPPHPPFPPTLDWKAVLVLVASGCVLLIVFFVGILVGRARSKVRVNP
jgi:hypothetical protein